MHSTRSRMHQNREIYSRSSEASSRISPGSPHLRNWPPNCSDMPSGIPRNDWISKTPNSYFIGLLVLAELNVTPRPVKPRGLNLCSSPPAHHPSFNKITDMVDSMTPPNFKYALLPLPFPTSIRLLSVQWSGTAKETTFDLVAFTLEDAPPYQAVSYVWGSDKRDRSLTLANGHTLWITENLETALEYVVKQCSTGYLWIDQLCEYDTSEHLECSLIF